MYTQEMNFRKHIMELENFVQFDADVLAESLRDIVYSLENSIDNEKKLKETTVQLMDIMDIYARQRAKIDMPIVDTGLSMIRQRY